MQYQTPVPDWSKAPWGLSVLARVASIFTGTSISPDALSRQRSNHYAFRAGRNLPDKEFRYLRTVIVTALEPILCGPREGAPFLPKLQGHFAEFLDNASSAGLGLLALSTCVGLRYGYVLNDSGFS